MEQQHNHRQRHTQAQAGQRREVQCSVQCAVQAQAVPVMMQQRAAWASPLLGRAGHHTEEQ